MPLADTGRFCTLIIAPLFDYTHVVETCQIIGLFPVCKRKQVNSSLSQDLKVINNMYPAHNGNSAEVNLKLH